MILLLNKPYGVICQFSGDERATLADHIKVKDVYPAGRLDTDSEGLVVLTDDGRLQQRIADPRYKLVKTYWVQVEGVPDETALARLRQGAARIAELQSIFDGPDGEHSLDPRCVRCCHRRPHQVFDRTLGDRAECLGSTAFSGSTEVARLRV